MTFEVPIQYLYYAGASFVSLLFILKVRSSIKKKAIRRQKKYTEKDEELQKTLGSLWNFYQQLKEVKTLELRLLMLQKWHCSFGTKPTISPRAIKIFVETLFPFSHYTSFHEKASEILVQYMEKI
jgi:hypothetical protein